MSETFSSQALKANLAQTQVTHIEIPDSHKRLLELSASRWDVHSRMKAILDELNHPYRNDSVTIEMLNEIGISDLWLYEKMTQADEAYGIIADIFEHLMNQPMVRKDKDALIRSLAKTIDRLAVLERCPEVAIGRMLGLIEVDFDRNPSIHLENSRIYKMYLNRVALRPQFTTRVIKLIKNIFSSCYSFWAETTQIELWYTSKAEQLHKTTLQDFAPIGEPFYEALRKNLRSAESWQDLHHLMSFNDISNHYRSFAKGLDSHLDTLQYLYYLLRIPGMSHMETHLIYDINRNLRSVFGELNREEIPTFIAMVMAELGELKSTQGGTVLDCIATLGREVIHSCDSETKRFFVSQLIEFGFDYPGTVKLGQDWRAHVNVNHIKQIRTWLELISIAPNEMRELLSALIVNLKLGGIFISDTDLFQRDVTKLLNADIGPVYREIKQLAKLFPIYFRDIGAEGKLRDYSTALDELSMRQDRLIHFLRKQIHTESNNTHIDLTRRIAAYWMTKDVAVLSGKLPYDVMKWITECCRPENCEWLNGVHSVLADLCIKLDADVESLLSLPIDVLEKSMTTVMSFGDRDSLRVLNLIKVHALLSEKYSLESEDVLQMVKLSGFIAPEACESIEHSLTEGSHLETLHILFDFMQTLKGIILDPVESKGVENFFFKRHVAAGIPSMYGQYSEPKFEALGLIYRLEKTATKVLEKALRGINLSYITAKTLSQLYEILACFRIGLERDGIVNETFNSRLTMFKYSLTSPSFSYEQYVNIFQFMARDVRQIIEEYFIDAFEGALKRIAPRLPDAQYSLESAFPHIYEALLGYAKKLIESHGFVHQEIEFTFESDSPESLYILQVRNQKLKKLRSLEEVLKQDDLCA